VEFVDVLSASTRPDCVRVTAFSMVACSAGNAHTIIETTAPAAFLTEKQAAQHLGLSPKTLRNWRSRGEGPSFLRLGSAVRYHSETLTSWALNQTAAA
jgi:predicted DNA-binding transcriptional regulator AlpA